MFNLWFAVEDAASADSLKKSEFGNDINISWFPATGDSKRPFPNLLNAVQNAPVDVLYYESYHQPLPSISLLRQVPTIVSLDAAPLRSFRRETRPSVGRSFMTLLNGGDERLAQAARQAAGFVVGSQWAQRELVRNFGVEPGRVLVARTGVDLADWDATSDAFQIARRRQTQLPERVSLLFAGDDFELLGGDLLLNIFNQNPELAELCELHFITRKASAAAYLASLAPNLKLHLHLHPRHEPAELYLNSDIYVLPARQPVSPTQLATALAAGLPVITSKVEGLTELVQDGQNGLLVEPGDEHGLESAIWQLVEDPTLRNELGQAARARAEAEFDAVKNSALVLSFIKQSTGKIRAANNGSAKPFLGFNYLGATFGQDIHY
jgi:glycosyltransferase involved in cell wall biosynthesis